MSYDWIQYVVASVFALIGLVCVVSVVVSLPGTWVMIALACLIELLDTVYLSSDPAVTFGWRVLLAAIVLAGFGELFEFLAGALGAKTAGSSGRGMLGALIGGVVGAIAGTFIPVPVLGTLIGAVAGTFIGASVGELSHEERTIRQTLKPATGATIGRLLGTLAKLPIAFAIWLVLVISMFV
ncbi:MAG: DUF456 domain-containing protein [Phycisphaerales bacterium]|nr:DUF456 domain-containing protein [Phycisphaerales bacterium]